MKNIVIGILLILIIAVTGSVVVQQRQRISTAVKTYPSAEQEQNEKTEIKSVSTSTPTNAVVGSLRQEFSTTSNVSNNSEQSSVATVAANQYWRPKVGDTWNIQYGEDKLDLTNEAHIYVVDAVDISESDIRTLHARGSKVICYVNAGAWEDWRPDAAKFPMFLLGNDYQGWPGENWLDIRDIAALRPLLITRLEVAKAKGCDGIDPDNINGYQNDTGFPLTADDQLVFNRWLSMQAHLIGLSIGLKNDSEQIDELLSFFDFTVTESCGAEGWCGTLREFIKNGKPVFQIEYDDVKFDFAKVCTESKNLGYSMVLKHRNLDAWAKYCK